MRVYAGKIETHDDPLVLGSKPIPAKYDYDPEWNELERKSVAVVDGRFADLDQADGIYCFGLQSLGSASVWRESPSAVSAMITCQRSATVSIVMRGSSNPCVWGQLDAAEMTAEGIDAFAGEGHAVMREAARQAWPHCQPHSGCFTKERHGGPILTRYF